MKQPRVRLVRHAFTKQQHWTLLGVLATTLGCGSGSASPAPTGESGGSSATGGAATTGGGGLGASLPGVGGAETGGDLATGGDPATGGAVTGGDTATGGAATGGAATGGAATGGDATGGDATGGDATTGGAATGGDAATGGAAAGGAATGGGGTVDCSTPMPTTGGETYTGSSVWGSVDGLSYGIWTNGNGGTITVFPGVHAFSASWDNSLNFLAHLGLDFRGADAKPYAEYGTIIAEFVEEKYGDAGDFSMIGIYGWMHDPCIEWYINEDSFGNLWGFGDVTAAIDGATYYMSSAETTGTDGANACESGHTGPWTQIRSTRDAARQCGTVTVSDHFKAWEAQGWTLGNLTSVHINVEVGGGVGSIEFPVANVTTSN